MKNNIFNELPVQKLPDEIFESIIKNDNILIERIISTGQTTPDDYWYDQEKDEWVILLKGEAKILIEGSKEIELLPGDYLLIPAHQRHRVTYTHKDIPTVWLAIHFADNREQKSESR